MTTLRVLISEQWPSPAAAAWALLDDRQNVLEEGVSEPQHWPVATRTDVVLMGAQYLWLNASVPRARVRDQAKALAFALESQLLKDVSNYHITPTFRGTEHWSVIVVEQNDISQLLARFASLDRRLDAVYVAVQTLPITQDGQETWSVGLHDQAVWVRTAPQAGFAADVESTERVPELLAAALSVADPRPVSVEVYGTDQHLLEAQTWLQALPVPVSRKTEWRWFVCPDDAVNLLHSTFLPRHRKGLERRVFMPAFVLMGAVAVLYGVLTSLDIVIRQHQLERYQEEMVRLIKNQLPVSTAVTARNPPLQMSRELNRMRTQAGELADDEPLSILHDFIQAAGSEAADRVEVIRYESGVLTLTLKPGLDTSVLTGKLALYDMRVTAGKGRAEQLVLRRSPP